MKAKSGQKSLRRRNIREDRTHFLMFLPFAALFFLFTVLPVISSIVLSLFDFDMITMPKWAGVSNYLRMVVGDEIFPKAVLNTLKFAVVTGPVSFLISFLIAWFINEFHPFVRNLLAFLFYAPTLSANIYLVWQVAFSSDSYGYINSFLMNLGLIDSPVNWFQNTQYNFAILVVIQLWMSMGTAFLANVAGLQNTNSEMYEAGALDGIRTRWHELWYITLPSMKSILLFSAVMQIQAAFSLGGVISALAGFPSVDNSVDTLVTHIADVGTTRYEMGYAAAMSVFLFSVMAVARVLIGKIMDYLGN